MGKLQVKPVPEQFYIMKIAQSDPDTDLALAVFIVTSHFLKGELNKPP